jgi:hypothetical protein
VVCTGALRGGRDDNNNMHFGEKIMKTMRVATCSAVAGLLLAAVPGLAQVSADGMGKVVPVEIYTCSFIDGKTRDDLDGVIERWNRFQDDNNTDTYAAWILTPLFYTEEQDFDILWLGAFRDGNAMGAGLQHWFTNGGELQAAFAEIVDCGTHLALASAMYKAPKGNNPPDQGYITMMDCKLNEGHEYDEIKAAELEWAAYLAKAGSQGAYYHWTPVFGGGEAEYDYKVVFSYQSFEEIGADFELGANGGGREKSREIFGDIDECDDARVYVAKSVRSAKIRD